MKIVHVYIKFQDLFSFAITERITTVNEDTFNKMVKGIGTDFQRFDKVNHIREHLKVMEVRQATEQDYNKTNTPYFVNEP
jgi:hypothetical protein